jgi:outer membrane protein assembly factor BamA
MTISALNSARTTRRYLALLLIVVCIANAQESAVDDTIPEHAVLERANAIIGEIIIDKRNIFDLSDPEEDKRLYRWANRLHVVTRDKVITNQLLFESGDRFSGRLLDESGRILRRNRYLIEAELKPVRYENGVVDVKVTTQDVWSLTPDVSISRSGGANRISVGIEETNLFGRGQLIRFKYIDDVDRTSTRFDFEDTNLRRSWWSAFLRIADNSDGDTKLLSLVRPFHALDARWTAGGRLLDNDRRTALYRLGNEAVEFRHEHDYATAFGGWSRGLRNGWTRRWTAGVVYDDNMFSNVPVPSLPNLIPENRKLVYPFFGIEIVEDQFETTANTNQMGRTEDFLLGTRVSASIGWSDLSFGADRDALIFSASVSRGFGSLKKTALLVSATASGRHEGGNTANGRTTINARFYHRQSEKRLFFMTLEGTAGHDLDLDNPVQLGGKSGLRGYPLRYQTGDSKLLFTIEQRFFADWYPFRLFRVGGAVFADVGRTWGDNPIGEENFGWLPNVGFGLRFTPTRFSTDKVAHLDFAFPLGGDASIDSVQILLEAKRGF